MILLRNWAWKRISRIWPSVCLAARWPSKSLIPTEFTHLVAFRAKTSITTMRGTSAFHIRSPRRQMTEASFACRVHQSLEMTWDQYDRFAS